MARHVSAWIVAVALVVGNAAHAALPCDADLNDDGNVGINDLLDLLGLWGQDPGGPPDFDGDAAVGITDMLDMLGAWGPIAFDFGAPYADAEAEQIGLEMLGPAGPLGLEQARYDRIVQDLGLIRHTAPALAGEIHSPEWISSELLVNLVPSEPLDEYLCLNEQYQAIPDNLFGDWWVLTLGGKLNVEALIGIYVQAPEVAIAELNFLIGGQNFWEPDDLGGGLWRWTIDDGWNDCFDGCDCHRVYVFETQDAGTVQLISVDEFGAPWCEFQ